MLSMVRQECDEWLVRNPMKNNETSMNHGDDVKIEVSRDEADEIIIEAKNGFAGNVLSF